MDAEERKSDGKMRSRDEEKKRVKVGECLENGYNGG